MTAQNQRLNPISVIRIVDGDTFVAWMDLGHGVRIQKHFRLARIDTPEVNSKDPDERERAKIATRALQAFLDVPKLECRVDTYDRYGRMVAEVLLPSGEFVSDKMLEGGYAVPYLNPKPPPKPAETVKVSDAHFTEGVSFGTLSDD
jgi:endonuclease YncB( thermonuclease family)